MTRRNDEYGGLTARPLPAEIEARIDLLHGGCKPSKAADAIAAELRSDIAEIIDARNDAQKQLAARIIAEGDAAAMAPGEPVAWAVFKGDSYEWVHDDEAKARENERDGYRIVPLYAAPPALPASVERRMAFMEVERAVAEERDACAKACDRVQEKLECGGEEQDLAAAYVAKKCAAAIRARGGAK